ncbi:hypothetical protein WAI453_003732 [Rhynchosporium graminicola]
MSFIVRKTESHGFRFDHCDDCKIIPSLSPSPSPVALLTDSNHETAVRPSGSRRKENLRQGTSYCTCTASGGVNSEGRCFEVHHDRFRSPVPAVRFHDPPLPRMPTPSNW